MRPAAALASLLLALLPGGVAAADPSLPPAASHDAEWAKAQSDYLVGRWAWSTPMAINIQPASGTITFAADGTYEADAVHGSWTLKPIGEGLFEISLVNSSGIPRRLVFRVVDQNTMHSEAEDLTYLRVG